MPRASWCLPYGVLSAGNGGLREANFIRKHKSKAMRQSLAIPNLVAPSAEWAPTVSPAGQEFLRGRAHYTLSGPEHSARTCGLKES